jgi:hypothetical protein
MSSHPKSQPQEDSLDTRSVCSKVNKRSRAQEKMRATLNAVDAGNAVDAVDASNAVDAVDAGNAGNARSNPKRKRELPQNYAPVPSKRTQTSATPQSESSSTSQQS